MRQFILALSLIVLMFFASFPLHGQDARNFKRGYGFGQHQLGDMAALSVGTTWWYNWWHRPENAVLNIYHTYGMEFVPQAWSDDFNETALREFLAAHPNVNYIMGFNEPNFVHQANMTPRQAAVAWQRIEDIADDFDLKIIGPALNYSPDPPYHDPFEWKNAWLAECRLVDPVDSCRFDYVNVHSYMNTVGALEWFLGEWRRYGKPIWLTEFCAWDGIEQTATPTIQQNFMRHALPMLDGDPWVYRYAWFIARSSGIPFNSLLAGDGELTPLGYIYTGQPVPEDPNQIRVTLSVVDRTRGVVTSSALWPEQSVYTWLGNTANWIGLNNMPLGTMEGNWVGMYNGLEGGSLKKNADAWVWSFTFVPELGATYNWNPGIWVDASRSENHLQAMHVGRNLQFSVNANGVVTGEVTLIIEDANTAVVVTAQIPSGGPAPIAPKDIKIFPNPAVDYVYVYALPKIHSITVFNAMGKPVLSQAGGVIFSTSHLPEGQYVVRIRTEDGNSLHKLLILR